MLPSFDLLRNFKFLQEIERNNLSERKSLVAEYNDLIESMKTEQKEEVEILKNRHEEVKKDLLQKNQDLEEMKRDLKEQNDNLEEVKRDFFEKKEDLEAALNETQEALKEKDQEIDDLNEEIFKVSSRKQLVLIVKYFHCHFVNALLFITASVECRVAVVVPTLAEYIRDTLIMISEETIKFVKCKMTKFHKCTNMLSYSLYFQTKESSKSKAANFTQ